MLSELFVRNFAIIDELRLQLDPGFNVLTGETGAGKSIILDAVTLILGGRADSTVIRAGKDEAYVEATFQLDATLRETLRPVLETEGLDEEGVDYVVLAREMRANGRNICRVNGRTVSLSVLRQVADPLIDIHGQGEHLSLLRPRAHLPLLDAFGGLESERRELAAEVHKLHAIQRELEALRRSSRDMNQRIEMLQFKVQEIIAAALKPDDEESLRVERIRLANAEQLGRFAGEAIALLSTVDEDRSSVIDLLGRVEHDMAQLARLDDTRQESLSNLQGIGFQLNEIAAELQDYLDALEYDPRRLNAVEGRLELISDLKRKYGEASVAGLLAAAEKAEAELRTLENSGTRTAELEAEQETFLRRIGRMAGALSQKRRAAAEQLSAAVETHLADLKMEGARFGVDFQAQDTPAGAILSLDGEERRLAFDQTGIDQVEFLISANPGEPLKPMARVASGGETARLMLALKTALAQVDQTPTLIFDEIDQGIGGRVGDVVGRKLWGLAAEAGHQVVVVTHLPQLAGYGDIHFHVSKAVADGRTITHVDALDMVGRVRELAAMLGTQGDTAVSGAESILRHVNQAKNGLPIEEY
ncbi:MAG TPA: DNA repair protein RecN [Promineifilum sp.]|nr:DNA repair protein RecN [Promineifilum sp.]HRO89950.1 DNA repair protein RecN [Promineifilum sp.]HRQ11943.1 DNA repair protein RecN [Promineifilum sp.]